MQITRDMLFPLAFYRKAKFNGSKGKMNYRIEKHEKEDKFLLTVWEGPECFDVTKADKSVFEFPFSDEGMEDIMSFLNTR